MYIIFICKERFSFLCVILYEFAFMRRLCISVVFILFPQFEFKPFIFFGDGGIL